MSWPEPMLSTALQAWPERAEGWVLSVKWDGFRFLVDVGADRTRGWSRRGTSLTDRVGDLLDAFSGMPAGTILDGELVALAERDGRPVQDFAAVGRAMFARDAAAATRLRFVAFDILSLAGRDVRALLWRDREVLLRETLPVDERVRVVDVMPASLRAHEAVTQLGFEGSVLKRPDSAYRPGPQTASRKFKARHTVTGVVLGYHRDREGVTRAVCDVDGRRVTAPSHRGETVPAGQQVTLAYSRVDAGDALREVRVADPARIAITDRGRIGTSRQLGSANPAESEPCR